MHITRSQTSSRLLNGNKLALAGVIASIAAIVGTAGAAAAQQLGSQDSHKDIVRECKDPAFRQQHHFKNVGQCIKALEGHGYGGGHGRP